MGTKVLAFCFTIANAVGRLGVGLSADYIKHALGPIFGFPLWVLTFAVIVNSVVFGLLAFANQGSTVIEENGKEEDKTEYPHFLMAKVSFIGLSYGVVYVAIPSYIKKVCPPQHIAKTYGLALLSMGVGNLVYGQIPAPIGHFGLVMRRISKLYYMRLEIRLYYMILDSTTLYYFLSYIKV